MHALLYKWSQLVYYIIIMYTRDKKSKASQISLFISKLHEIVGNRQIADIVSWTTTHDSFIIKSISKFTEQVLPAYYKHHNFASFIRQLNVYNFKKIRHSDGDNVYMNQYFIEGAPNILMKIIRKSRQDKQQSLALYNEGISSNSSGKVISQIEDLKTKQEKLQEMCRQFLMHNQKLIDENQKLAKIMNKQTKQKQKKLQEFLIYLVAQKNYRVINPQSNNLRAETREFPNSNMGSQNIDPDATPLELLANSMDKDQNFKKVKSLLQNAFNGQITEKRRDNNFTIVSQQKGDNYEMPNDPLYLSDSISNEYQDPISQLSIFASNDQRQQDNISFLSIKEYMNEDDCRDFNSEHFRQ